MIDRERVNLTRRVLQPRRTSAGHIPRLFRGFIEANILETYLNREAPPPALAEFE